MLHALAVASVISLLTQPQTISPRAPERWRIAHEIMLLVQLNTLRLTQQQVAEILNAYSEVPSAAPTGAEVPEEVVRLKQRLLRGERVGWRELRDVLSTLQPRGRGGQRWQALGQIADRVMGVLKDWQLALLNSRTPWGARRPLRRGQATNADALVQVASIPPEEWTKKRDELAQRIAGPSGGGDQVVQAARDFLDRLHSMDETTIRSKSQELFTELQTLVPEDIPAEALIAPLDHTAIRKRLMALLADPTLPDLLREMAEARGWTSAAQ